MSDLVSWNYQWSEAGGSSWNDYLRNRDIVRAINGGTAAAAVRMANCMDANTREVLGSVRSLERSLESGFDGVQSSIHLMGGQISTAFTWGFSEMLVSMGGMQTTLDALLKVAKTPTQTAAFEQFEIARDAFRKGLYPECLEALEQAVNGVAGVATGYKLEWRFHHLRGLVLLGSHDNSGPELINPVEAEKAFLNAARYAKFDFPKDAAKAFLSAGWAAYVQVDRADSLKLRQALEHTENAVDLDPELGEGLFQLAKFRMALGKPEEGLAALGKAAEHASAYLVKAASDGDFGRHAEALDRFFRVLRQEKEEKVRRELGPVAELVKALQNECPSLRENSAAQRVVEYGSRPESKELLELFQYHVSQWPMDREELRAYEVLVRRVEAKEWDETVIENVPTGAVDRVEETIQESYSVEETVPRGWFRKESRVMVQRTRPKLVVREVPRMAKVEKRVRRREYMAEAMHFFNGLGESKGNWDKKSQGVFANPIVPSVWIEPGTFFMGSPDSEDDRSTDKGRHQVTVTKGFFLSEAPCTQSQWKAVMGSNPSRFKETDRPVENVSWGEAVEFCRKLTKKHQEAGVMPQGWLWRLPTEAEWEYAARAGTTGSRYGELDAIAWWTGNSGSQTHPVKQKTANAWGLYDMMGNVWEWCSDWYGEYPTESVTDPTGPNSGSRRVTRGGSWSSDAGIARSAIRSGRGPGGRDNDLGFRPALSSVR